MNPTTYSYRRVFRSRRSLIVGVIALVLGALTWAYVSLMTAHTIAPPGLRILDFLWTTLNWLRA